MGISAEARAPIHLAPAIGDSNNIIIAFIEVCASLNVKDWQLGPIHHADERGHRHSVVLLLNVGSIVMELECCHVLREIIASDKCNA